MLDDFNQTPKLVAGRSCGQCSLCCKLPRIGELDKPAGDWCTHCAPGRGGCKIYQDRPSECRNFYCAWRLSPELGPEWRPLSSKMVLIRRPQGLLLLVDPGNPTAWLEQPYYKQLKDWAVAGVSAQPRQQVLVYNKNRVTIILPNKEVDLGALWPGDHIMVSERNVAGGRDWQAYVVPAKDMVAKSASASEKLQG
jgi:hypothetical protein